MGAILMKDYGFVFSDFCREGHGASGSSRFNKTFISKTGELKIVELAKRANRDSTAANGSEKSQTASAKRTYRMNVSKFKRKAVAYCSLSRSQKFLAFYTVTFPAGFADDLCFRVWNIILTRCRQDLNLRSYLWVMERQRNGTIHYHMLTHDYMPIGRVNGFAAHAIDSLVTAGLGSWGNSSLFRYHGVDVRKICDARFRPRYLKLSEIVRSVARYLAKYMSKELSSESHRVWHCSRLVSALITGYWVDDADFREVCEDEVTDDKPVKQVRGSCYEIIFVNVLNSGAFRCTVSRINDAIFELFDRLGLF